MVREAAGAHIFDEGCLYRQPVQSGCAGSLYSPGWSRARARAHARLAGLPASSRPAAGQLQANSRPAASSRPAAGQQQASSSPAAGQQQQASSRPAPGPEKPNSSKAAGCQIPYKILCKMLPQTRFQTSGSPGTVFEVSGMSSQRRRQVILKHLFSSRKNRFLVKKYMFYAVKPMFCFKNICCT